MAITWEEVAAIGLELPATELSTSYGTPALKVRKKLLARLRTEDDSLVLLGVPVEERETLVSESSEVFHVTPHYEGYPAVLARLSTVDPAQVRHFLLRRWREVAPKRLVAELDERGDGDVD